MPWRIGCRDRGSLGNPTGQTNDRLCTGMNGGGIPLPDSVTIQGSRIDPAIGFTDPRRPRADREEGRFL